MRTGLLQRHPANRVAPFSLAVPPVGVAAAMPGPGETVTRWQRGGIVLVAASLALALVMALVMVMVMVMLRPRVHGAAPV